MESQTHEQVLNEIRSSGNPQETNTDGSQMFNLVPESMSQSMPATSINRGRSKVWNEFVVTNDGKKVECRRCRESLSYSHSHSTSSMLKHLKRKHNIDLYPPNTLEHERFDSSQQTKTKEKQTKKSPKVKKLSQETPNEEGSSTEQNSIQHDTLVFNEACVRLCMSDHNDTLIKTFSLMYKEEWYTDCTIVAEKQFFKGHRLILSSASSLFDEMFKSSPVPNPIIFLTDVKAMELRLLLDFIYKGEVSIPPSLINSLVKVGSELKVKGLSDFVWNDQLASTIFQGYQSNIEKSQHVQQHSQISTVQNSNVQSYTNTVPNSISKPIITAKVLNSERTMKVATNIPTTSTFTYVSEKNAQPIALPGATRTYARLVSNVRSVNVIPSQQNNGINIGGDGSQTNFFNQTASGLKRIRIVTAASLPAAKSSMSSASKFNTQHQASEIGMDCDSSVLMVTNQGETVLSTSQVMTPNSISLPMGSISIKDERLLGSRNNTHNHFQSDHINTHSHPITILSGCGGENSQDLDEVVYSITEVPGGGHEVLMSGTTDEMDSDSIVVYGTHENVSTCESQDKKPFHLSMQK